jgi:large subunit ribosomal protein L10
MRRTNVTREEKAAAVAALHERFAKASVALVTTNRGLSVQQANRLRRTLKAVGGEYKVCKHTLTRRALDSTRYGDLQSLLEGPRGLVFGYADPVVVTKALVEFSDENEQLAIEGGAVEGQLIQAPHVKALATMPSLEELRGHVVMLGRAPGARVVSAFRAPAARIAGAIAALVQKLEGDTEQSVPK